MSQDIDAKAQAELVERLDSHMGQADMGEVLRDCRLARDVITTLTAERDALVEQAFRDGIAYASMVKVTDVDLAWEQSRARAALSRSEV